MKKLIILFLLFTNYLHSQPVEILIKNGKIIDGSGNNWFYGDIAIDDGKIAAIGKFSHILANKVIDAKGMVVSPGFIDVHGHIEGGIIERPAAENYIYDGVTTVITGNCGNSAEDLGKFFEQVKSANPSINVASLVGHNTVRKLAMGLDDRKASPEEQQKMNEIVHQGMLKGAVGLSTGLIYLPGMYSDIAEIISLAKVSSESGGIYASHIRNEEDQVTAAINEAIQIGKDANIPVQISHFKVSHKANWGRSNETLLLIEKARKEGIDVTIDQYPYTASSTNLGVRLPDWALAGGHDALIKRMDNAQDRKRIIDDMLKQLKLYSYKNYSFAVVANHSAEPTYNGKSITEINTFKGKKSNAKNEAETILELMRAGGAQMVYHGMDEDDVQNIMRYPFNMIGADAGVPIPFKSIPHPRAYGTNARVLARYVQETKIITLEDAIRRMTSLAAQKFHLNDRGLLRSGMAADILIFDPSTVRDKATYEQPHQYSEGFQYVLVNGNVVVENGKYNGTHSGVVLYGPGYKE